MPIPAEPATSPAELDPQRPWMALCEPDASLRALLVEWLRQVDFAAPEAPLTRVVLVIADVPAPRHDGAARIASLRQRYPGAKVLAISGQFTPGQYGATAAAIALGADAVLAKPFAAQRFIDTVRALADL